MMRFIATVKSATDYKDYTEKIYKVRVIREICGAF